MTDILFASEDVLLQNAIRPRRTQLEHGATAPVSAMKGASPRKLTLSIAFHLEPPTFCTQTCQSLSWHTIGQGLPSQL